jgi:hypothetical protein
MTVHLCFHHDVVGACNFPPVVGIIVPSPNITQTREFVFFTHRRATNKTTTVDNDQGTILMVVHFSMVSMATIDFVRKQLSAGPSSVSSKDAELSRSCGDFTTEMYQNGGSCFHSLQQNTWIPCAVLTFCQE